MADRSSSVDPQESGPQQDQVRSGVVRKGVTALAGGGLVVAGVVMLVTPGPGVLTIIGGLAVLGREFETADRAVKRIKRTTIDKIRPT